MRQPTRPYNFLSGARSEARSASFFAFVFVRVECFVCSVFPVLSFEHESNALEKGTRDDQEDLVAFCSEFDLWEAESKLQVKTFIMWTKNYPQL